MKTLKTGMKLLIAVLFSVGLVGCADDIDFDNFRLTKGKMYVVEQLRLLDKCNEVKLMDDKNKSYAQVKVYFTDCQNKFKPNDRVRLVPTLVAD